MMPKPQAIVTPSAGNSRLLGSTLLITAFTAGNLILNFLLQIALASFFGAHADMDAFLAATTLPTLVNSTLLGAFNFVLVPLLVELRHTSDESYTWNTTSHLVNATALLLGAFTVAGMIAAPMLVGWTNPGFSDSQLHLTLELFGLVWPSLLFVGLSNLLASVYYARRQFAIPSLAPVLNVAVELGTVVALGRNLGIYAAAAGMLLGAVIQLLVLTSIFFRPGRYSLRIELGDPINRRVLTLMAPLVLGSIFYKASGLVERLFASSLGEGSISYLGYAFKLATALEVMIAQGVSISFLPLMSSSFSQKDLGELRRTLSIGLRGLLVISLPVAGLVFVLAHPMLQLLLERGAFDPRATEATSQALIAYLGWVCAGALGAILTNVFYARQDTLTVVKVGILGMGLYLILAYLLAQSAGFVGLALALSTSAILNALIFMALLHRRLDTLEVQELALTFVKSLGATLGMIGIGVILWPVSNILILDPLSHTLTLLLRLTVVALLGMSVYVSLAWAFDLKEIKSMGRVLISLLQHFRQPISVQATDSR
jgi:putative peptidoglycan lipid II flippase